MSARRWSPWVVRAGLLLVLLGTAGWWTVPTVFTRVWVNGAFPTVVDNTDIPLAVQAAASSNIAAVFQRNGSTDQLFSVHVDSVGVSLKGFSDITNQKRLFISSEWSGGVGVPAGHNGVRLAVQNVFGSNVGWSTLTLEGNGNVTIGVAANDLSDITANATERLVIPNANYYGAVPFAGGAASKLIGLTAANNVAIDPAGLGTTIGGATPTPLTNIRVYAPNLTPAGLAAAIGVTEQTFTVTGLTTADNIFVTGPAPTALCPPVTYRVSAADTLAIGFADLTVALCTPAAGVYPIVAVRS